MSLHKNVTGADLHAIHAFTYANASARTGATGLGATDVGKVALQADNNSYWVLTGYSIVTWAELTSVSGAGSNVKAGVVVPGSFSGSPKKATVTFGVSFSSTAYSITLSPLTDGSRTFSPSVESKTAAGFVVNLNANNVAGLIELGWQSIVSGG